MSQVLGIVFCSQGFVVLLAASFYFWLHQDSACKLARVISSVLQVEVLCLSIWNFAYFGPSMGGSAFGFFLCSAMSVIRLHSELYVTIHNAIWGVLMLVVTIFETPSTRHVPMWFHTCPLFIIFALSLIQLGLYPGEHFKPTPVLAKRCQTSLCDSSSHGESETRIITVDEELEAMEVPNVQRRQVNHTASPRRQQRDVGKNLNWKKGALLGQGGYGRVHVGLNCDTGELMAVKSIQFNLQDAEIKSKLVKLQNEISTMKQLDHPNVIRYLFTERAGAAVNIFMEYVPGGSLADVLKQFGSLSLETACYYTRQILIGIQYLHSRKVVHRDIKGANILITVDGECKLGDFGASALVSDIRPRRQSLEGTPFWMAPEVVMQQEYDESVDVWSLGCTVQEMLTANVPFRHMCANQLEHIRYICNTSLPIQLPPECLTDKDLTDFCISCLQRDPVQRQNATRLLFHTWPLLAATESNVGPITGCNTSKIAAAYIDNSNQSRLKIHFDKWERWAKSSKDQRQVQQKRGMINKVEQMTMLMLSMFSNGLRMVYFNKLKMYWHQNKRKRLEGKLPLRSTGSWSNLRNMKLERHQAYDKPTISYKPRRTRIDDMRAYLLKKAKEAVTSSTDVNMLSSHVVDKMIPKTPVGGDKAVRQIEE